MNGTWFHGSPYCCFTDANAFAGTIIFLTARKDIASTYCSVLGNAGNFQEHFQKRPTIYEIEVLFDEHRIFDCRQPQHKRLFQEMRRDDSKPDFGPLEQCYVTRYETALLPSFYWVTEFRAMLARRGFRGSYHSESGESMSLAVWNPAKHIRILSYASKNPRRKKR